MLTASGYRAMVPIRATALEDSRLAELSQLLPKSA
jgi:hypothetical protein|tara:strand:+ start:68 stop:172 length:105 start_codon:yes stop_codon:yes gene_type:complete